MNPATTGQVKAARADAVEVLLTPSLALYREMGDDIEAIREQLDLGPSVSNTQVIAEALRRQADRK
jgi:hypothetical protein